MPPGGGVMVSHVFVVVLLLLGGAWAAWRGGGLVARSRAPTTRRRRCGSSVASAAWSWAWPPAPWPAASCSSRPGSWSSVASSSPRSSTRRAWSRSSCAPGKNELHGLQHVRRDEAVARAPAPAGVEQHRAETGPAGAQHVHGVEIAHVHGLGRRDACALQREPEDPWIRLLDAHLTRVEHEVELAAEPE